MNNSLTKEELLALLKSKTAQAESDDRIASSLQLLRFWLAIKPESAALRARYADKLRELGNADAAEPLLMKSLEDVEAERRYFVELSLAMLNQSRGEHQLAESFFRAATASSPEFSPPWDALGSFLSQQCRFDEAREAFERALKLADDDDELIEAQINIGKLDRAQGNLTEALGHFHSACMINPNHHDAAHFCDDIRVALKLREEFIPQVQHIQSPDSPDAKSLRSKIRRESSSTRNTRNDATQVELLRLVCLLAPTDPRAKAAYGSKFGDIGNARQAETMLRESLEKMPAHRKWTVERSLGHVYRTLGMYELAESFYRSAVGSNPSTTSTWIFLGCFLSGAGRLQEAIQVLELAQNAAGDPDEVQLNLGNIQRALENNVGAMRHYEIAMAMDPDDAETKMAMEDIRAAIVDAQELGPLIQRFSTHA